MAGIKNIFVPETGMNILGIPNGSSNNHIVCTPDRSCLLIIPNPSQAVNWKIYEKVSGFIWGVDKKGSPPREIVSAGVLMLIMSVNVSTEIGNSSAGFLLPVLAPP